MIPDFAPGDSFRIKISHNPTKDLTGGSLVFVMKKRESDTEEVLRITHSIGADTSDVPLEGTGYISVSSADTLAIPVGRYFGTIKRVTGLDVFTVIRTDEDDVELINVFPNLKT